jgi:hypothetical protein
MHRRADVSGLGAREPRVEGLATPKSVESGKLSVNNAGIRGMSDKNRLRPTSCSAFRVCLATPHSRPQGTKEFFDRLPLPSRRARAERADAPGARTRRAFHRTESYLRASRASASSFRRLMDSLQLRPSLLREFHGFNQHENFGKEEKEAPPRSPPKPLRSEV